MAETPHLTNESIFGLTAAPDHLIVIGGGPIGCELAQAHRNLGCSVTVIEAFSILPKDDPDLADIVRSTLTGQGIALAEGTKVVRTAKTDSGVAVTVDRDGTEETIEGSHLLVAVGRKATVDGLGLDRAGIKFSPKGINVNAGLRTSNRRVYAIGDCVGGLQFTHVAAITPASLSAALCSACRPKPIIRRCHG